MNVLALAQAFIKMLRLRVLLLLLIFAYLGALSVNRPLEHHPIAVLQIIICIALWYASGACINDLADEAIDRINLKHAASRPLANNKISRRSLWLIAATSALASVIVGYSVSTRAGWLIIALLVLNWLYSMPPIRISYRGLVAPLLLPIGYVLFPYLLAVLAVGAQPHSLSYQLLAGLYVCFCGRIILKDMRDVLGDTKFGKRTFIVRHGLHNTLLVSGGFWLVGSSLLMVTFLPINSTLVVIIMAHLLCIFWCLAHIRNYRNTSFQQVGMGAIGKIATATLACCMIALPEHFGKITRLSRLEITLCMLAIAIYAAADALYAVYHPAALKVSY